MLHGFLASLTALATLAPAQDSRPDQDRVDTGVAGERLPRSALGPGVVETMERALERSRARGVDEPPSPWQRNGAHGVWIVPPRRASARPHSGERYVTNRWGDTRMGIGFPELVHVRGAWIAGQASEGAWAEAVQVIGYREGREVGRTEWFEDIDDSPSWFAMDLEHVDRIEVVARAVLDGAGWYALDDLTYESSRVEGRGRPAVVDFDDVAWDTVLSGSGYAGLTWETGTGTFEDEPRAIHPPVVPPGHVEPAVPGEQATYSFGPGTLPNVVSEFPGMRMFEPGTSYIPPDTCGAVGPDHFVSVVNVKLGVFDKATGARLFDVPLATFFSTTALGDPRVTYDHHSGRYFLLASSGPSTARLYLAISMTGDPTGAWFKTWIDTAVGADAGRWPDYPTLGVDADGFYAAALMVPSTMTIWAIEKAPLLTVTPSLQTVTAWRDLPFEGAMQPCVTYGDSGGELLVSRPGNNSLRIRQVVPPITAPTLSVVADVKVPVHWNAPSAPALGSATNVATGDTRPMNSVYRGGSVFTAHTISVDGRAGCRWYELEVSTGLPLQIGTIGDPLWHYYYPSIAVNALGHVVLGFSGSHAGEYAGAFYTGRHALDPPNVTAAPAPLEGGKGAYNHVDGNGQLRWGDYSLTSLDPSDDTTFWTIQEYARQNNRWGTWVGELAFDSCPTPWTYCADNPDNVADIAVDGCDCSAGSILVTLTGAPAAQSSYLLIGSGNGAVTDPPGAQGDLCLVGAQIGRYSADAGMTDGSGSLSIDVLNATSGGGGGGIPDPPGGNLCSPAGQTWNFQYWHRDGMNPSRFSKAISVTFD